MLSVGKLRHRAAQHGKDVSSSLPWVFPFNL